MSYGLTTVNGSDKLTMSTDGYTYGYIGKATLVSITPPGTDTVSSFAGFSTYTITWPGKIIVALPIKSNGAVCLLGQSQSGSTWTIKVHKSNGSSNALSFKNQEESEVFVFGAPVSVSDFGVALYSASGELVADLGRRPLSFDRMVSMAANVNTASFSGLTKPAVIGTEPTYITQTFDTGSGPTPWVNRIIGGAWRWDTASGLIERDSRQEQYFEDDGPIIASTNRPAATVLLLEANALT